MLAAPFASGAGFYAFYAVQPHLLELYGDPNAYSIAGLAAALVAGTQILGGWAAPKLRGLFEKRTTALIVTASVSATALVLLGLTASLVVALVSIGMWGLMFAADEPIRQAYVNDMIPSKQRATVLSFDSLLGSSGGVVLQPGLGRVADVHGYPISFVLSGLFAAIAVPFLVASRREHAPADRARDPKAHA
jgi:MFS family permease